MDGDAARTSDKIGLHVALTPTWSETAWFADYILPMGLGTERHDTMSQETHAGQWLGFRQPVLRVAREKTRRDVNATHEANPGEVWEEIEFWIALTLEIDPDGRSASASTSNRPYRPGEPITMDEYYGWMFENSVPGLPEAAATEDLTPLQYMRKYGVFKVKDKRLQPQAHERPLADATMRTRRATAPRRLVDGVARRVQHAVAQARVLLADAGRVGLARARGPALRARARALARPEAREGEFDLLPNFRLPTLIHTRSPVEVAVRDLARQPALDRDGGRAALRCRDGRSRQGADANRLLRDARLGDRRDPSRRRSACRTTSGAGGCTKRSGGARTRRRS